MKLRDALEKALKDVDWNSNVNNFCSNAQISERLASLNYRLALWARQLEKVDRDNPAICFVREMQVEGQLVAVSIALATYKLAAGAMRSILEGALYYTYFRSHPAELATLARSQGWYIEKGEILEYHKLHTPKFQEAQKKLSVVGELNTWYSKISSVVHGQLPGLWHKQTRVSDIKYDQDLEGLVLDNFEECVEIVNNLLLCTVGAEFWDYFSSDAKKQLIKGLSGDIKEILALDKE